MSSKETKSNNLEEASKRIEAVKQYAWKAFGFFQGGVSVTWSAEDPAEGCGFEVNGVRYEVDGGKLSIVSQGAE